MDKISIRKIQEVDVVFLHSLMNNESILKSLNEVATTLDTWETAINEWNNDDDEEDYLILENDHLVGWLAINNLLSDDKRVFLKMISILPDKQGLGIGVYTINDITAKLKSRGFKSICLYTDKGNINARKCYQKCGFIISESVTQKMSNGKYVERIKMENLL